MQRVSGAVAPDYQRKLRVGVYGGWIPRKSRREATMKGTFDEALECLRGTGAELAGSVAPNHGPMAAEALVALGRDDLVVAWADRYRRKLATMPPPSSPISAKGWAEALGSIDRFGDWAAFFRVQLAEAPWQAVFTE